MNIVDVMKAIEASSYDVSAYRRNDKTEGWQWEVGLSQDRSQRISISVSATGKTFEEALEYCFTKLDAMSGMRYGLSSEYIAASVDDDIPF